LWADRKRKWFYFANYEGVRSKVGNPYNAYSPVTDALPTPDEDSSIVDAENATGCNTNPVPDGCSQLSYNLIQYFPINPGFTADPDDPTIINFNFNSLNRADNLVFKSDYHVNEHHVLTGRFIYANSNQTEEDAIPQGEWLSQAAPARGFLGWTGLEAPNSRLVMGRFGYNRLTRTIAPADANSIRPNMA
jgi:hypothetical protein